MSWTVLGAYLAMGTVAGVMAGLLGVGGGLVLVGFLIWVLPRQGFAPEVVMHVALGTSLASIVVTSLSSTYAHARRHVVHWRSVYWLVPGMLIGGFFGSLLAYHLPGDWLLLGFSGFCVFAAYQVGVHQTVQSRSRAILSVGSIDLFWGGGIGLISALVGIGGGSMTVPLLLRKGAQPIQAVATSSACGSAIALSSAFGYVLSAWQRSDLPTGAWGYVYWPGAALIALASMFAAPCGVALAHYISADTLKRIFAVFLLFMGCVTWFSF
jgi:uncharacterized membrane protein YfcA